MKITDRDKKILYVLAAIAIVFCGWFFGYRNIAKKSDSLDTEIAQLKVQVNELRTMVAQSDMYRNETMKNEANYKRGLKSFDSGYSQEHSIMFVTDIEASTNVWINQIGMAQTENIYKFGQLQSSNPRKQGQTAYESDYLGYRTNLTLAYQGSYENFQDMIEFIVNYKSKSTINSISMSYNEDGDMVSGTMVVSQFAVTGADRPFNKDNYGPVIYGTENIFNSEAFVPGKDANKENGEYIISDYDYFMSLSKAEEGKDAVTLSQKGDIAGKTTISSSENDVVEAYIRFFQEDSTYKIQYSIGDEEYPEYNFGDGAAFIPGEDISLLVVSSSRSGDDDAVAVEVNLVNETDMTVNVKVLNDDAGNPRFILKDAKGEVRTFK